MVAVVTVLIRGSNRCGEFDYVDVSGIVVEEYDAGDVGNAEI